ncbi:MAG TPA: S53 family peptidase [Tepidisphaeraceae bacterium]|nr:S53 family peptidase [Tepidisphaeraceae bacterium]
MPLRLIACAAFVVACTINTVFGQYTPQQIIAAYGINNISFGGSPATGAAQTIAIVDAYNDSAIQSDLQSFDSRFGIPDAPSFSIVNQGGGTTLPTATNAGWAIEMDTDVELAHAIAPQANILLVETNDNSLINLTAGVATAAATTGVSVVTTNWGSAEFLGVNTFDSNFITPANHSGVTFVATAGGSGGVSYPASVPSVLAVGGTSLQLDSSGKYAGETTWDDDSGIGGGGTSIVEGEPTYQNGVQASGFRTTPDVAFDADLTTGFYGIENGTLAVMGTANAAAANWAGLIALADQGRAINGLNPLDSSDLTNGLLPMLYALYGTPDYALAFNDITTGLTATGQSVGAGYDTSTGLGSPKADVLIPYLAGYGIVVPEPCSTCLLLLGAPFLMRRRIASN